MPPKTESPDIDEIKKKIETELKALAKKTKGTVEEAQKLREEKEAAEKAKDKTKTVDLQKELKKLEEKYMKEAESTNSKLDKALKDFEVPKGDERGFAKWYADIVDKESGIDMGKDVKLWGEVDAKKGEVKLILKGKF
jgi:exonuclease VII large subunit